MAGRRPVLVNGPGLLIAGTVVGAAAFAASRRSRGVPVGRLSVAVAPPVTAVEPGPGPVVLEARGSKLAGAVVLGLRVLAVLGFAVVLLGLGQKTGRYRFATVLSGSMKPVMAPGSEIIDRPIALTSVRVGDIITFESPTGQHAVVTHRVVRVLEGGPQPLVETKGDANALPDPSPVRLTAGPAWRVSHVLPDAGWVLVGLRTRRTATIIAILLTVTVMAMALMAIWRPDDAGRPQAVRGSGASASIP